MTAIDIKLGQSRFEFPPKRVVHREVCLELSLRGWIDFPEISAKVPVIRGNIVIAVNAIAEKVYCFAHQPLIPRLPRS